VRAAVVAGVDLKLRGKSVVVTGASKGIGRAIAYAFLREGANVALSARTQAELDRAVREGTGLGGTPLGIVADVTREDDIRRIVDKTIAGFGAIDVLVNNAGGIGAFAPFEELTLDDWRRLFELNLFSVVALIKAVLPVMRAQRSGRIVNISSESALQPDAAMAHYNASKAALNSLTKSLSKAVGEDGILVNTVSPAFIKTPLIEEMLAGIGRNRGIDVAAAEAAFLRESRPNIVLKRAGTPEEVASAVVFLASSRASFITGTNVRIDGGSVATV
jgi:3-oxoacyl-[acyl-carrier protein] reductase